MTPKTLHKDIEIHAHWDLAHPMDYFSSPRAMNANFDLSFVTRLLLKMTKKLATRSSLYQHTFQAHR